MFFVPRGSFRLVRTAVHHVYLRIYLFLLEFYATKYLLLLESRIIQQVHPAPEVTCSSSTVYWRYSTAQRNQRSTTEQVTKYVPIIARQIKQKQTELPRPVISSSIFYSSLCFSSERTHRDLPGQKADTGTTTSSSYS